ncbi:MAG: hypothetical protein RLZZ164_475 [Actinomycetota bacterium]|jgi:hypothetical protein
MSKEKKAQDVGQQLDELQAAAIAAWAEVPAPPGVETIGEMAEWGNQGVDRYFIYPDVWEHEKPYLLFKTNPDAQPSSTYIWRKIEPVWLPDEGGRLFGYRIKGDWYQEVTPERAAKHFPDAFPNTPDVSKSWRVTEGG